MPRIKPTDKVGFFYVKKFSIFAIYGSETQHRSFTPGYQKGI